MQLNASAPPSLLSRCHAGCADFVPDLVDEGGLLSSPKYERLEQAYARARDWLKMQRGIRLVNIQSIDYKLKSTWGEQTYSVNCGFCGLSSS